MRRFDLHNDSSIKQPDSTPDSHSHCFAAHSQARIARCLELRQQRLVDALPAMNFSSLRAHCGCLVVSPCTRYVALCASPNNVTVLDVATLEPINSFKTKHAVTRIHWSKDSASLLAVQLSHETVELFSRRSNARICVIAHPPLGGLADAQMTPDARHIIVSTPLLTHLLVYSSDSAKQITTIKSAKFNSLSQCLAFSRCSQFMTVITRSAPAKASHHSSVGANSNTQSNDKDLCCLFRIPLNSKEELNPSASASASSCLTSNSDDDSTSSRLEHVLTFSVGASSLSCIRDDTQRVIWLNNDTELMCLAGVSDHGAAIFSSTGRHLKDLSLGNQQLGITDCTHSNHRRIFALGNAEGRIQIIESGGDHRILHSIDCSISVAQSDQHRSPLSSQCTVFMEQIQDPQTDESNLSDEVETENLEFNFDSLGSSLDDSSKSSLNDTRSTIGSTNSSNQRAIAEQRNRSLASIAQSRMQRTKPNQFQSTKRNAPLNEKSNRQVAPLGSILQQTHNFVSTQRSDNPKAEFNLNKQTQYTVVDPASSQKIDRFETQAGASASAGVKSQSSASASASSSALSSSILGCAFSHDDSLFAVRCASWPSVVRLYCMLTGALIVCLRHLQPVRHFDWSPCTLELAIACGNSKVYLWQPRGGSVVAVPQIATSNAEFAIRRLKYTADGQQLILQSSKQLGVSHLHTSETPPS